MSFQISDLIIESVLRDGFEAIRRDESIIDDVFAQLTRLGPLMSRKFGKKEINRIKRYFTEKEVSIVQSFSQVVDTLPCISIQLIDNPEDMKHAHLDDFEAERTQVFTDPEELEALVIIKNIEIDSYDEKSGTVYVNDSANLDLIHAHHLLVDIEGNEFQILGGIVNIPGSKQMVIEVKADINIAGPALVKSSIDFKQWEQRGLMEDEKLLLGIHTEERLLTIYLYTLVKYFIASRKLDLINRGFLLATYSGSDFTRANDYVEPVWSRYLTVSGKVQNYWMSDKVIPIDLVDVQVLVEKDKFGNDILNREDQTVQVDETDPETQETDGSDS